jgi:hypothetical protein
MPGQGLGIGAKAQRVCVVLNPAEGMQLAAIMPTAAGLKHVERARIVLASADRYSAQRVAKSIGVSRPTAWRWQQCLAVTGIDGLLRNKLRKARHGADRDGITVRVVTRTAPWQSQPEPAGRLL